MSEIALRFIKINNLFFFHTLNRFYTLMILGIYFETEYLSCPSFSRKPFFFLILRVLVFCLFLFPSYKQENHLACVVNR